MLLACPSCGNTVEVATEHLGQVVECPHCRQAMQAPAPMPASAAARVAAVAAAPPPEPTKKCPHCGGTILKVALRCKFCKQDIPAGFDEESAAARLRAKEPLIAEQAVGNHNVPSAVTRWFQKSTCVLFFLTLAAVVTAAIGFSAGQRSDWFFLGPLGFVAGLIVGVITLIFGARDLFASKYFGRKTPVAGAKAFWGGLCAKRYLFAYYCVLDADKDESPRSRPAMPKFNVPGDSYSFDWYEGFRDYWQGILHGGSGVGFLNAKPTAAVSKIRVLRSEGDLAEISATIKLTRQSTSGFLVLGVIGALLFADRDALSVKKLFRCVDGQWYAVNGELDSGEDRFGYECITAIRY